MSLDGVAFVSSLFFFLSESCFFLHQRFRNPRTGHLLRDFLLHTVYDTVAARISSLFVGALTMDVASSALCGGASGNGARG